MEISKRALKRIRKLKGVRGLPKRAGLRLGLSEDNVFLKWEEAGPTGSDLIVMRRDLPIIVDAQTYLHLADYELDFERDGSKQRFLLRHRST